MIEKFLNKIPFYKLPFTIKLFIAKIFIRTLRGFGSTFMDDIILYNELSIWIETKGKPTTTIIKGGDLAKKMFDQTQIHN